MRIGLHVSASGGADKTIARAKELQCETFQFFSRSPQGGKAPTLSKEIVNAFKEGVAREGFADILIHTPYFINFASTNPRIKRGSAEIVREELERATLLGVPYVVTHLGAAKDIDRDTALTMVAKGLQDVFKGYRGTAMLLLENAAGSGTVIGDTFEELAFLLSQMPTSAPVGVCLDTCHLFASGYDLRTPETIKKTLTKFQKVVGMEYIKYIHANDSKGELGDKKDRHEHIGYGKIGAKGFSALLRHPKLQNIPFVLETHHDGKHIADLKKLKALRP